MLKYLDGLLSHGGVGAREPRVGVPFAVVGTEWELRLSPLTCNLTGVGAGPVPASLV
jgi:hypothetical protein